MLMRTLMNILMLSAALVFLPQCKDGRFAERPQPEPIQILSLSAIDYNSSQVEIRITGILKATGVAHVDYLQFYDNSECKGNTVGQVLAGSFDSQGVTLILPPNPGLSIYVSSANSSECMFMMTYSNNDLVPSAPKFVRTSPLSPTRETASPGIFGSAFPASATIRFFDDSECSQIVGQGTVKNYSSTGIGISLQEGQTSSIYAQVTDVVNQTGPCTFLTDYSHSNTIIAGPVFVSSSPNSPNNISASPVIKGSLSLGSTMVSIYSDSSCSQELVSGSSEEFSQPGLQVELVDNSSTNLYAKSIDANGDPSACVLLTTYVHDTLPPNPPSYLEINPVSPNNNNTFPRVKGLATTDTLTVNFYDSSLCLVQIGSGLKSVFEGPGLIAGVGTDATTFIYAKNLDASGNASSCTYLTQYKHNTIPPNSPVFSGTTPASPTNSSTTPLIYGTVAEYTHALSFYDDENCTQLVGSGPATDYIATGISLSLSANKNNQIYVRASDLEGNISSCQFLANYDHSNVPANNPNLLYSFPASPTKTSTAPYIVGTADPNIATVRFYNEATCTSLLGSGSRGQFTSAGIPITVPSNSTTDIYAIATNIYGNDSSCELLLTYIHNTIPPDNPSLSSLLPLSPNAVSTTPQLTGTATTPIISQLPPFKVSFYDSPGCVSKIGEGPPTDYMGTGILINVPSNAESSIYAKVFDEAGNGSTCTFLANYIHDNLKPGKPLFTGITPNTPSFSENVRIQGVFASSTDFLSKVSMNIYSDVNCASLVASGTPTDYETVGIALSVPLNQTTNLYGASRNEVGTYSDCQFLKQFTHRDTPPQSLTVVGQPNGSIYASWLPDLISQPMPKYTIERSLSANGPFSIIATAISPSNFTDNLVSDATTYYYRVFSSNSTGRSKNSSVATVATSVPTPIATTTLQAYPGSEEVRLVWSGNIVNMTYRIYRSQQPGGPFAPLPVELMNTTYTDTSVVNNVTYYYVVTGTNPVGESIESNMASAFPRPLPSPPTDLLMEAYPQHNACAQNPGLQLSWGPSPYYDTYNVMRGSYWSNLNVLSTTNEKFYVDCNLVLGDTYSYAISSQWGTQSSLESNFIYYMHAMAPTLDIDPGVNENVLTWNEPAGGTFFSNFGAQYNIFRSNSLNGPFTQIASGHTSTSFTDTSLIQGTVYYYYIQAFAVTSQGRTVLVAPHSIPRGAAPAVLPGPPSQLNLVENLSSGAVELSVVPPSYYNFFKIYHSNNVGGPFAYVGKMPNTFLPAAPVNEGMNYFYVTASWGSHETSPSNTVSYRSASISGFTAIPSASDIALAWNPVNNAQDYTILRGLGYNGPFTPLVTVATNSHTDSTVVGATGYFYKVRANFSDSTVGRFSNPKGAMLTGTHTPTGISLRAQSAGIIKVNWAPVTNAVSNKIYVATSAMGSYTLKATVYVGSEALVGGLSANTEYFIKIQTRVGVTDYDSSIHSELTYQLPDAPTGLIGDNNIDLTWTGIPGVIDYEVLRSLDGINFAPIATNLGSTAFSDNSVSNGQLYYYKLRANFSFGSDVSVSSSGLSPGIVPTAPTRLLVENDTSGTDLRLHWDKVESVNKYNIYVSTTSGSYSTPFTSSTSYQDVLISGLSLGTTYYLIVKSVNGTLESLTSSPEFSIETALTTAAPTVQAANASDVNISWPPVTGATSYNILRSRDGYSFEVLSSGETGNSFVDSTTDPSQTYFYKYQSYKSANVPMAYSQVSSGISIGTSSPAPEGVSISSNVLTAVDLSWIASPATVSYSIFRSLNSGGPYSLLSSVSAPSINFTDSAVTPGGSYFYVIQSVNANGVSSVNSAEVGITLSAAPTNLIANNQEEGIQLSWDTVVGATRYQLLRSGLSGGPYGLVASPAGNSYLDTNTLAGETYFYVVLGEFADGSATLLSSEVSLNRSGSLDLEVPIELTDTRLASASSEAISFERTMTSLDTNDYDGVSSYQFEVIVSNSDNIPHEIYLVNTSDIVVASLSVPASTLIPTRLRAPFSPDVGDQTYRLRLEATTIDGQLVLESARILIKQVNATKTRLYFPLLSVSQISTSADATSPALSTNLSTYQIPSSSLPFTRTTNDLASIALSNAWELEALVSTSFSAEGSLVLQNTATGLGVATSETRFAGDTIMMANIPIDEGSNQFATANENHQYQIQVKCEYNCAMGNVMLYKAGIWVRLENLSKAISYYRNSSEQDLSSVDTTNTSDRTYIDTSLFKNPTAYFEARAYDDAGSMTEVTLLSHPEDSGAAGLILVTNSTLSFDTGNVTTSRSVLSLPLTSGHRFVTRSNASGGDTKLIGSAIIIKSSTP